MSETLEFYTKFKHNGVEYTISCYDPFQDNYWVMYIDYYGMQYKWMSAKTVKIIMDNQKG